MRTCAAISIRRIRSHGQTFVPLWEKLICFRCSASHVQLDRMPNLLHDLKFFFSFYYMSMLINLAPEIWHILTVFEE